MVEMVNTTWLFWTTVAVAGAFVTLFVFVAMVDRALQGRIREIILWYTGVDDLKKQNKETDEKLARVCSDISTLKRSNIDMATAINNQSDIIVKLSDDDVDLDRLNKTRLANELYSREDHRPGEFLND